MERAEAGDLGDPDERLIEAFKAKNAARLASKNKQQTATYPLTTKRTQKLQDELPMVTMAKVISSKSNSDRRPEVAVKAEASEAWLDRSDYIQVDHNSGRTYASQTQAEQGHRPTFGRKF